MTRCHVLGLVLLFGCSCGGGQTPPPGAPFSPPTGQRYIVGGDSRSDGAQVVPWAFREAKARGATAFFFLGDMELTPELDSHFRAELALLAPIPFYPALGNHEVRQLGILRIGVESAQKAFRRRFLEGPHMAVTNQIDPHAHRVAYSVDVPGGVHFIVLDNVTERGFGDKQLEWLADDLERAHANPAVRHILVGMHEAPAHNGVTTHAMDEEGEGAVRDSDAAVALFQKANVEMILASHAHQFTTFTVGGIRGYITGGLGAPLDRVGPEHAFHHFLQLDVSDTQIQVTVVRFEGHPVFTNGEEDD
jgi:hypothetical protein